MRARPLAAILAFAAILAAAPTTHADDSAVEAFVAWSDAVIAHTPGKRDASVESVWKMKASDTVVVEALLQPYIQVLLLPPVRPAYDSFTTDLSDVVKGVDPRIVAAGIHAKSLVTPRTFLERSAVLHADAAMFDQRPAAERHLDLSTAQPPAGSRRSTVQPSGAGVVVHDGEVAGMVEPNWNWAFSRWLIDRMKPFGMDEGFVSAWYHGTGAYLMRHRDFAEVVTHLDHAAELLPNDARILFDRGTVYESLAMNLFQQASDGQLKRPDVLTPSGVTLRSMSTSVTLPAPAAINLRARRLYERALELNPGFIEAHVRLARELELSGDFSGATREVAAALKLSPTTDVAFYAHLFGARAATALGRDDAAEAHVTAALQLYPDADSAWLAASQAALHRADPNAALERMTRLEARGSGTDDPWQRYPLGTGRIAELALTELWGFVPASATR
jgi:hypothetical protein